MSFNSIKVNNSTLHNKSNIYNDTNNIIKTYVKTIHIFYKDNDQFSSEDLEIINSVKKLEINYIGSKSSNFGNSDFGIQLFIASSTIPANACSFVITDSTITGNRIVELIPTSDTVLSRCLRVFVEIADTIPKTTTFISLPEPRPYVNITNDYNKLVKYIEKNFIKSGNLYKTFVTPE